MKPQSSSSSDTWTAHPARQRPRAAFGAMTIILLMGAAAWMSFGLTWGIGSVLLLVASLNRFFLPSRFTMNELELVAKFPLRTQRIQWLDVRRFVTDEHGGYLSTRSVPSRIDAYRGVHLLFGRDREEVVARIQGHMHSVRMEQTVASIGQAADEVHHSAAAHVAGGSV